MNHVTSIIRATCTKCKAEFTYSHLDTPVVCPECHSHKFIAGHNHFRPCRTECKICGATNPKLLYVNKGEIINLPRYAITASKPNIAQRGAFHEAKRNCLVITCGACQYVTVTSRLYTKSSR